MAQRDPAWTRRRVGEALARPGARGEAARLRVSGRCMGRLLECTSWSWIGEGARHVAWTADFTPQRGTHLPRLLTISPLTISPEVRPQGLTRV
jgi:hypothetical protein